MNMSRAASVAVGVDNDALYLAVFAAVNKHPATFDGAICVAEIVRLRGVGVSSFVNMNGLGRVCGMRRVGNTSRVLWDR